MNWPVSFSIIKHIDLLRRLDVCHLYYGFAKTQPNLKAVWHNDNTSALLLELLDSLRVGSENTARSLACWTIRNVPMTCGSVAWDLLSDERSKVAVKTAEAFIGGNATSKDLAVAFHDAHMAYWNLTRGGPFPMDFLDAHSSAMHAALRHVRWWCTINHAIDKKAEPMLCDKIRELVSWEEVEKAVEKFEEGYCY